MKKILLLIFFGVFFSVKSYGAPNKQETAQYKEDTNVFPSNYGFKKNFCLFFEDYKNAGAYFVDLNDVQIYSEYSRDGPQEYWGYSIGSVASCS